MKKLFTAVLLVVMASSCTDTNFKTAKTTTIYSSVGVNTVVEIDSCEYLVCEVHNGVVLTHKGNCKNPIHKGGNK